MGKSWILPIILLILISGCSNPQTPQVTEDSKTEQSLMPPNVILQTKNHSSLNSILGSYEWNKKGENSEEISRMDGDPPHILAKDMKAAIVEPGEVVTISFDSESKPTLNANLWGADGNKDEVLIDENKITLPSNQGQYIYEIIGKWPQGNASYIFVVEIE